MKNIYLDATLAHGEPGERDQCHRQHQTRAGNLAMTPIELALGRLERVRQGHSGQWIALCPAHPDRNPSLSIRETPDGAVLLHCFAGCECSAVLEALGLQAHELFPPKRKTRTAPPRTAKALTCGQAMAIVKEYALFLAIYGHSVRHGHSVKDSDHDKAMWGAAFIVRVFEGAA